MAWFNHVSLGSDQQQQLATGSRSFTASDALSSSLSSGFERPTEAPLTVASQHWTGSSAPRPEDFPSAPRGLGSPPSLENLTCSSFGAAQTRDPEPISYVSLQEQRCVLSWFQGWTPAQRERFLQDLLGKAVPGKICTLLDSLSTLQVPRAFSPPNFQSHAQRCAPSNTKILPLSDQVKDKLPNIFECQLRLWSQWFESWSEEERNHFLHMLEEREPVFVAHFYRSVAGTAGKD